MADELSVTYTWSRALLELTIQLTNLTNPYLTKPLACFLSNSVVRPSFKILRDFIFGQKIDHRKRNFQNFHFLWKAIYGSHGGSLFRTGIEFVPQDRSSSLQKLSFL